MPATAEELKTVNPGGYHTIKKSCAVRVPVKPTRTA
jgi:hypothetical protein